MKLLRYLIPILLAVSPGLAATYHIDFAGGDNAADGLTPDTAWKHSPGDRNATDNPANVALQPGDTVLFKGGVQYFGEIVLKDLQGTEAAPIIFDGNTAGSFGEGRAILDGAEMITGWQPVESAEQAGGNPLWEQMMFADLDVDLTSNFTQDTFVLHRDKKPDVQAPWQRVFLIDGERRVLPIAQRPKPADPFYPDLPADFWSYEGQVADSYPHEVFYEEGSRGNRSLPLIAITFGGNAPVIEPLNGGAISVEMNEPATVAEIGVKLFRPTSMASPEEVAFLADGEEVFRAKIDQEDAEMQRFALPEPIDASKLTFQFFTADPEAPRWSKLQQIAAYTPEGNNLIEHDVTTVIEDPERLNQDDPSWYDDVFVGLHGGNNHVYFAKVRRFDPATGRLFLPHFTGTTYNVTKYAIYNAPKLIDLPGEWCVVPLEGGRSRVFLLPEDLVDGQPANIGYPELSVGLVMDGKSAHLEVRGFIVQRFAGGIGGIATQGRGQDRPSHIRIADNEVRFLSTNAGISLNHSDNITVENCYVHHCPGWTVGTYVNRIRGYQMLGNRMDTNSGSGIRHYEAKDGVLRDNVVLNHYGMHSSGINFYEGCENILFEDNYVENVIAINRMAKNLTFRNNVVDSEFDNAVGIAMWGSGRTGDRTIQNLTFENNTFINLDPGSAWGTSIFFQSGPSVATGVVIRNNILDRLRPPVHATVEQNIFMRETDPSVAGEGSVFESDPEVLFLDPANGDYRRKPGGPLMDAGADVPPPPATWEG